MIVFDLICDADHQFEGWFRDANEFTQQQHSGLLTCPVCDSANVVKLPSASRVNFGKHESKLAELAAAEKNAQQLAHRVHQYIEKNYEDVGGEFSSEAKKMHYGEIEERNIRGTATAEDAKQLKEEGIDIIPLPDVDKKDKLN